MREVNVQVLDEELARIKMPEGAANIDYRNADAGDLSQADGEMSATQNFSAAVTILRSADYLDNIRKGAMSLLGNHLIDFGNTLSLAVSPET